MSKLLLTKAIIRELGHDLSVSATAESLTLMGTKNKWVISESMKQFKVVKFKFTDALRMREEESILLNSFKEAFLYALLGYNNGVYNSKVKTVLHQLRNDQVPKFDIEYFKAKFGGGTIS